MYHLSPTAIVLIWIIRIIHVRCESILFCSCEVITVEQGIFILVPPSDGAHCLVVLGGPNGRSSNVGDPVEQLTVSNTSAVLRDEPTTSRGCHRDLAWRVGGAHLASAAVTLRSLISGDQEGLALVCAVVTPLAVGSLRRFAWGRRALFTVEGHPAFVKALHSVTKRLLGAFLAACHFLKPGEVSS